MLLLARQTPTFNAKPIVAACIDACRRGIQVTIYVDLGFNDQGESMPFQGGTNEQVVERMYKDLNRTNHQKNLHVYWYTSKDQIRPLNAVKKQRNCHVKVSLVAKRGYAGRRLTYYLHPSSSCKSTTKLRYKETAIKIRSLGITPRR